MAPSKSGLTKSATSKKSITNTVSVNGKSGAKLKATATTITKSAITAKTTKLTIADSSAATCETQDNLEFQKGDKVVYPPHGVGVVESIQIRQVMGREMKFYHITFPELQATSMVSVIQAKNVGLRRVVDNKTVEKVYDILKDRKIVINTQTWNRRQREYSQKIKTGSVLEIARVIRDLSVLKGDKELSFGERRMLDTAQKLLVKEISIAKSRSEDTVLQELNKMCLI